MPALARASRTSSLGIVERAGFVYHRQKINLE
jgi:hypothetical protein